MLTFSARRPPSQSYKGFAIIPAATKLADGQWKLQGAINPDNPAGGGGFGENLFESQNRYPSKEAAERHFIEFAKRYIDGTAKRADIDQNQ